MKEMKEVIRDIRCKLREADKYAKEAVKHKMEYPEVSSTYARIANDDMEHVKMLKNAGHDMVEKYGDATAKAVWAIECEMAEEDIAHVKRMLSEYR